MVKEVKLDREILIFHHFVVEVDSELKVEELQSAMKERHSSPNWNKT